MAQRIKLACQLIAIDDLIHAVDHVVSQMIPDKYLYEREEPPEEYKFVMNATHKLHEATREIDKAKKLIKPEITNLNISNKL